MFQTAFDVYSIDVRISVWGQISNYSAQVNSVLYLKWGHILQNIILKILIKLLHSLPKIILQCYHSDHGLNNGLKVCNSNAQ